MFLGIIIELGSLRIWSLAGPIDGGKLVEAIAIQALGDIAWTEDIRIISVVAFLAAILCASLPQSIQGITEMGIV